jgi:two-component system nitrogen regulation response regulator GlnG
LRDHPEDLGSLLLSFLQRACAREGRSDLLPHGQCEPLQAARWASLFYRFSVYAWPGNVRQLENFANQVVLASDQSPVVPPAVSKAFAAGERGAVPSPADAGQPRKMRDISEREFDQAMSRNRYEINPVAQALGVTRQAVYRRIDKSAVYCRASEIPAPRLREVLAHHAGDVTAAAVELKVSESALRARLRAVGSLSGS